MFHCSLCRFGKQQYARRDSLQWVLCRKTFFRRIALGIGAVWVALFTITLGAMDVVYAAPMSQLISEFEPNPPGTDPANVSIELSGTPGTAFTGWVVSIENDGANGIVDRATQISGTFDANGLLVGSIPDLENPSFTIVLLSDFTGSVGATDIDTNDDGVADDISSFGTVYDAIGVPDAVGDALVLYGSDLGGTDFAYTGDEPRLIFRDASIGALYAINDPDNGAVFDVTAMDVTPAIFDTDPTAGTDTFGAINPTVTGTPSGRPFPLSQGFDDPADDCGITLGWQVVSVDVDAANTWSCSSQFSNADVNGFGDSAAADEWLITPPLNMEAQTDETLNFRSWTRFTDLDYPQLEVVYSTDYDGGGDPTEATWTELMGITYSPEDSQAWTDSGSIDLSAISGTNVYFAFHYSSSGTTAGSAAGWRLDAIEFGSDATGGPVDVKIHEIQGTDVAIALNQIVAVSAVVVGDFQSDEQLRGFFIQEEDIDADSDASTSEGIFVFCGGCATDVAVGDIVEVTGLAEDFFGMSQIDVTEAGSSVNIISSGNALPAPVAIDLPASGSTEAEATFENVEGMLVQFTNELFVSEYFELARYGQLVLTADGNPRQFTDVNEPDVAGYASFLDELSRKQIILDDDNNIQNDAITGETDEPYFWPRPGLSTTNLIRGGDSISNLSGVLHWSFAGQSGTDAWRVRPVEEAFTYSFSSNNSRTNSPEDVGGSFKVASFNVLNYFTTLGERGAESQAELDRQRAKIASAICAMDADVVGLIEIENNGSTALLDLLEGAGGVNANCGPYSLIDTGVIGTDEIAVAFIYKAETTTPLGTYAVLDSSVDARFIDTKNRPVLAQTFEESATGGIVTIIVNHLKSKGSSCNDINDPGLNDGAANCNLTRASAAAAMVDWLSTDPTDSGDPDFLIIGDLNAYRNEDPIDNIKLGADDVLGSDDDYTDLLDITLGDDAYTYLFDSQRGYLDYALANTNLFPQVTGVTAWHINADEIPVFDYNDAIQDPGEASFRRESSALPIYEPDAFRASDHDPVIVGLNLEAVNIIATCGGYDVILTEAGEYIAPDFAGTLLVGTNGRDWLRGTSGPDLILGLDGGDDLFGYQGNDVICGGSGKDVLKGHVDDDILDGGADADYIVGGPGADVIIGGEGADDLVGNSGHDMISGGDDYDVIIGGSGDDSLFGENDNDDLYGQSGDDALDGGEGDDFCNGGSGNNTTVSCESGSAVTSRSSAPAGIDALDITNARLSNDGANGENATAERIVDIYLPFIQ